MLVSGDDDLSGNRRSPNILTKRQFVGVILTVTLFQGTVGLIKLWAARHSTHSGVDGTVGRAAQIVF